MNMDDYELTTKFNPCPKCQCSDCINKKICGDCRDCGNANTVKCKKYKQNPNAEWSPILVRKGCK